MLLTSSVSGFNVVVDCCTVYQHSWNDAQAIKFKDWNKLGNKKSQCKTLLLKNILNLLL